MAQWIWQKAEWPNLTYDASALNGDFERITAKAGYLAGVRSGLSAAERRETFIGELTEEAINSYAIEGESLDPKQVRDSLTKSLEARDMAAAERALARNQSVYAALSEVILDSRDGQKLMSVARLNDWHAKMFKGPQWIKDIGRLRTDSDGPMQVVTTNRRGEVSQVHYEAPPALSLKAEMDHFVSWLNKTGTDGELAGTLPTPARAALAHLKFEFIHPYADGNGRIGRGLTDYVASQSPIFSEAPFSISRAILADRGAYYGAFEAYNSDPPLTQSGEIDATNFVRTFGRLMEAGIDQTAELAIHISSRHQFMREFGDHLNQNQAKAIATLFERGPERLPEGMSNGWYKKVTGVSRQTASRDLAQLVEIGALRQATSGGRSTSYPVNIGGQYGKENEMNIERDQSPAALRKLAEGMSDPDRRERALAALDKMAGKNEPANTFDLDR